MHKNKKTPPTQKVNSSCTPEGDYSDSRNDVHHGKGKHMMRTAQQNGPVYLGRWINASSTNHDNKTVKSNIPVKNASHTIPTHLPSTEEIACPSDNRDKRMRHTNPERKATPNHLAGPVTKIASPLTRVSRNILPRGRLNIKNKMLLRMKEKNPQNCSCMEKQFLLSP